MANAVPNPTNETKSTPTPPAHDEPLKGTFVSVMLLGAFLALTWAGIFILFLSRN